MTGQLVRFNARDQVLNNNGMVWSGMLGMYGTVGMHEGVWKGYASAAGCVLPGVTGLREGQWIMRFVL